MLHPKLNGFKIMGFCLIAFETIWRGRGITYLKDIEIILCAPYDKIIFLNHYLQLIWNQKRNQ
jgi:hypothetical protein